MKREQIIEILQDKIELSLTSNYKSVYIDGLDKCADAILALPLDVPSDAQITIPEYCENQIEAREFIEGAKWMRDEIINRNK